MADMTNDRSRETIVAHLKAENERLRVVLKRAARELYALEVRRQSMGWEDGMTERLIALQHHLAAEHNDGPVRPSDDEAGRIRQSGELSQPIEGPGPLMDDGCVCGEINFRHCPVHQNGAE